MNRILSLLTRNQLRDLCRTHGIRHGQNKQDHIRNIHMFLESPFSDLRSVKEILSVISTWLL